MRNYKALAVKKVELQEHFSCNVREGLLHSKKNGKILRRIGAARETMTKLNMEY